jgi:hypothetical protein
MPFRRTPLSGRVGMGISHLQGACAGAFQSRLHRRFHQGECDLLAGTVVPRLHRPGTMRDKAVILPLPVDPPVGLEIVRLGE